MKPEIKVVKLISKKEVEEYYNYLLNAFKKEFMGLSRREIIEKLAQKSKFSKNDKEFLKLIVTNGFLKKDPYPKIKNGKNRWQYPIELIDYIIGEGYTPSSLFVKWVYKKLGVKWDGRHWYRFLMRDIAPIDLKTIKKEVKFVKKFQVPQTLEIYYRMGSGLERMNVQPDIGVRSIIQEEYKGRVKYKGFDPIDYLDYYYGGLDIEDMTIARHFYSTLLEDRHKLKPNSTVLIVGNGPVPDEAQALSMVPQVEKIIPADIDPRNIEIMKRHTGGRNPLATQKARPGEEHADFIYYLFEKYNKVNFGFFPVREITAAKSKDPVFIDVSKENPLEMKGNSVEIKKLKADLVVVPFCPESITKSLKSYKRYIQNISNLVYSKKHLCMLALKNAKYYLSGTKKLNAVPINEYIVSKELTKNGFTNIKVITINTGINKKNRGFSDSMIIWADKE